MLSASVGLTLKVKSSCIAPKLAHCSLDRSRVTEMGGRSPDTIVELQP